MTKRRLYASFLLLLAGSAALLVGAGLRGRAPDLKTARQVARRARIRPDYADIVVPPNIAPLNFVIQEPARRYYVRIGSAVGPPVEVASRDGKVQIPLTAWRRLLTANTDREFSIRVFALAEDGQWDVFEPALNKVAAEPVDPYLFYRFINSVFTMWVDVSMHERRLEDFEERLIVDSDALDVGCVNCHTFLHGRPDTMLLHMRHGPLPAGYGSGMVMIREGKVSLVDTRTPQSLGPAGFTTWHPSGRLMVFSMNRVTQFFHGATTEVREVVDLDSDLAAYYPDLQTVASVAAIAQPNVLESWPEWSADGRYLYYCAAPVLWEDRYSVPPKDYEKVRYALMRISYDVQTGAWGQPETVLSPEQVGLSITQPRASPDGRFLLLSMCDRSTFPSFRQSADLYMLDLASRSYWRLECNSDQAESWHCWSANGRWIVFSTKRDDGLFVRPYFSYVSTDGHASKPFLLPQEDPAFYDSCAKLFQVPEFAKGPLPVAGERLARVMRSRRWTAVGTPTTGGAPGPEPAAWGEASPAPGDHAPWYPAVGRE